MKKIVNCLVFGNDISVLNEDFTITNVIFKDSKYFEDKVDIFIIRSDETFLSICKKEELKLIRQTETDKEIYKCYTIRREREQ